MLPEKQSEIFRIVRSAISAGKNTHIQGVLLFGSSARGTETENSDIDAGVIYEGEKPQVRSIHRLDLFLWSREHWTQGFALQLPLVDDCRILYDPEKLIQTRLSYLKDTIDRDWFDLLRKDFP